MREGETRHSEAFADWSSRERSSTAAGGAERKLLEKLIKKNPKSQGGDGGGRGGRLDEEWEEG